jgi:hypothetical protein
VSDRDDRAHSLEDAVRVDSKKDHVVSEPGEEAREPCVSRRTWIGIATGRAALAVIGMRAWPSVRNVVAPPMTVYKSPSCGCCVKWVEYMRKAGFAVTERNVDDVTPIKRERGVPEELYSCHTAVTGDYIFEGHVPADLVQRVLRERPAIRGLAAPGMPQSAPGMDMGHERYQIMSFTRDGKTKRYATRP